MQVCSEAPECSYRLGVSACGHCYIMFGIADVHTGSIPIQFGKTSLPILLSLSLFLLFLQALRHITVLILLEIGRGPARLQSV